MIMNLNIHSRLRSGISWCQVPQRVAQPSPQADLLALGLQYLAPLEIPRGIPNGCHIDAAWDMVPSEISNRHSCFGDCRGLQTCVDFI